MIQKLKFQLELRFLGLKWLMPTPQAVMEEAVTGGVVVEEIAEVVAPILEQLKQILVIVGVGVGKTQDAMVAVAVILFRLDR